MDEEGFKQHWLIGESNKRDASYKAPNGRKPIGKFGIGKLATYVLANRLTHIAKVGGKYFATTMDYREIPQKKGGGIKNETVQLSLRQLSEAEAKNALGNWLQGEKVGFKELKLFGVSAWPAWTVAILSDLKEMSREIQFGRLKWVLATAMPLRDDFDLYFDGDAIEPSKVSNDKIGRWILGKDLKSIQKPAPDDLKPVEDKSLAKNSSYRFGFLHPKLGKINGYVELYEQLLTAGKSVGVGRSHGFFVYVHDRLINIDDEYFGIDSNLLRHGTFARFRMVLHADKLDEELRSSRETLREGPLLEIVRNILHGTFNFVRGRHQQIEVAQEPGAQTAQRIAASPASLVRRPLVNLVKKAINDNFSPIYTKYPKDLSDKEKDSFIDLIESKVEKGEPLVKSVELSDELSSQDGIGSFDVESATLKVNILHPYVAHFLDEYDHQKNNISLELLVMSEILLEGHLYELGFDKGSVREVLTRRDEILRHLSKTTGKRNALMVAQALRDACMNKDNLETELVSSFDSMGFNDAEKIGGKGKPDGFAAALLAPDSNGETQSYRVTLEAKSKESAGTKVTAKDVNVAAIIQHRDDFKADYAVVVGPDFPTTQDEESFLGKSLKADREKSPGKGITLIRIEDMARLVRLMPAKRVGLQKLRQLFQTCSLPSESKKWIDALAQEKMAAPPYRELLQAIADEQKDSPGSAVEYASICTRLSLTKNIKMAKNEVKELCKSLSTLANGYVFARDNHVELMQRPDKILEAISATVKAYPDDEQKQIVLPK